MFSNLTLYRFNSQDALSLQMIEEAFSRTPFQPCGATMEKSAGWVPARGEANGQLVESVGGHWIAKYQTEAKQLPPSVLNRKVQEKADAIEKEFGRKPGKKEKRDLKDEARLDLLPAAFTKLASTWLWIDPTAGLIAMDTTTQARADEIITLLVESIKGLGCGLIDTQTSAQAAMAHWLLTQEPPAGFTIDRQCTLKAADESKAVIRYARHPLDIDEIRQHVEHGKLPVELAITWDERISFVLTDALTIKKLELLDGVMDKAGGEDADKDGFDTDVAIFTGEATRMLPDLFRALGGLGRCEISTAAPAGKAAATGPAGAPVDTDPEAAPF